MAIFVVICLGIYVIIDSLDVGLWSEQRLAYSLLFGVTALLFAVSKRRSAADLSMRRVTRAWYVVAAIGVVMIPFQTSVHYIYVIGDAAVFVFPLLLLEFARRDQAPFTGRQSILLLTALLTVASICAFVFARLHGVDSDRFPPPPLLLMAIAWLALVKPTSPAMFAGGLLVTALTILLTLESGARFVMMLWAMMGVVAYLISLSPRRLGSVIVIGAASGLALIVAGLSGIDFEGQFEGSRLGHLLTRLEWNSLFLDVIEEESMNNRIRESSDALHTRFADQGILCWIFGSGHGATFDGVTANYGDRLLDSGQSHHIHFGLVLLYYRYGIVGVMGYLWLLIQVLRRVDQLRRADENSGGYRPSFIFTIAAGSYLINLLMSNELINPMFSYSLVGFIATRHLPLRPITRHSLMQVPSQPIGRPIRTATRATHAARY